METTLPFSLTRNVARSGVSDVAASTAVNCIDAHDGAGARRAAVMESDRLGTTTSRVTSPSS